MRTALLGLLLVGCSHATSPTEPAIALRWDFSSTRTLSYDYEQRMGSSARLDEAPPLDLVVRGGMDVMATGHGTANVVLRDLVMTHGEDHETVQPAMLPGVNEDGSSSAAADDPRLLLLKVLAPLPHRTLEPGQSDEVLVDFPVTVDGKPIVARGGARVTLRSYEAGCAILDAVTDVGHLDVPEAQRAAYDATLHGTSTMWFSLADHALRKATLSLTMTTRAPDKAGQSKATRIDTALTVSAKVRAAR